MNPAIARLKTAAIADIQQVLTQFSQALTVFDLLAPPLGELIDELTAIVNSPTPPDAPDAAGTAAAGIVDPIFRTLLASDMHFFRPLTITKKQDII